VTATPLWFGPTERPLFGWLHIPPSGEARAGVVLCPPLGIEAICVYFSYRALAQRLTAAGLAVVRFDYDGTGDSFGQEADPGRVNAWLSSVEAAVNVLDQAGVSSIGMVGMRMGALFAASEALRRGGVDALVLWDPCVSGQSFLREQQALRMVSLGGEDSDGAVDAPGLRLEPATVADLSPLDLTRMNGSFATRLLVLQHPERVRSRRLTRRLDAEDVDWDEATGQGELLDPPRQEPPYPTIDRVSSWLDGALGGEAVSLSVPGRDRAVVGRAPAGHEVVERAMSIGPAGLFGIVTEPSSGSESPTIVLVNEGNTPHIGQSRMWVELARSWGAAGLRVLRFDLSGNGDSDPRPGRPAHVARAPEAYDDVVDAARAVCPDDPSNVVLVGLCAGAYQAMEVALSEQVRGICVLNPVVAFIPPEVDEPPAPRHRRANQSSRRWFISFARAPVAFVARRRSPKDEDDWAVALKTGYWAVAVHSRRPQIPGVVWRVVDRLLLTKTPAATFEQLSRRGIDTLVICGEPDLADISLGTEHRYRRLARGDRFQLQMLEGLDHSVLIIAQRRRLPQARRDYVVARYGPDSPVAERAAVGR
jgi:pimeloyl-ACP methyl ester carboxylesterase